MNSYRVVVVIRHAPCWYRWHRILPSLQHPTNRIKMRLLHLLLTAVFFSRCWLSSYYWLFHWQEINQSRFDDKPDDWQGFQGACARSHYVNSTLSGIQLPRQWFRHPLQIAWPAILPQFGELTQRPVETFISGTLGLCNRTYLVFVPQAQRVYFLHTSGQQGAVPFLDEADMTVSLIVIHFWWTISVIPLLNGWWLHTFEDRCADFIILYRAKTLRAKPSTYCHFRWIARKDILGPFCFCTS